MILCFALVGPFGLEGVAVAVAVPNVLFCLFAIGYACFVLDVGVGRYLLTGWLKPLVAACVPAAVWWFATPVDSTWSAIGMGIGMGLVPFVLVVVGIEGAPLLAASRRRGRSLRARLRLAANSALPQSAP